MQTRTRTMQPVSRNAGEDSRGPSAGLVLLYASEYAVLPPAFVFDRDVTVIGREPPPGGLRIPQDSVSRLHARIAREGAGWTLTDLESRNGTLVNGRAVSRATLEPLDEIRLGDAIFTFVDDGASAFEPYRIDGAVIGEGGLEGHPELVGGLRIRTMLAELAAIAPTDLPVLVLGETGTGKELVARAIHDASRRSGPFRGLNCAAIPPPLLESELFGYRRGAFTGAHKDKLGLVQTAEGGTLLLDELGDLPLEAQAKLLRMLETREVTPLGGTTSTRVDVRLVCATQRPLVQMVEAGAFRPDLFARINGYGVNMPPLRDRREDLYALVRHFLAKHGRPDLRVTFSYMAAMCRYAWPFNVRELEAAVRRGVAVAPGGELDVRHLPDAVRAALDGYGVGRYDGKPSRLPPPPSARSRSQSPTEDRLRDLLARHAGNVAGVARELGRDRAQVHRWLRSAGLDPNSYRG